jgi:hypothetical protein
MMEITVQCSLYGILLWEQISPSRNILIIKKVEVTRKEKGDEKKIKEKGVLETKCFRKIMDITLLRENLKSIKI